MRNTHSLLLFALLFAISIVGIRAVVLLFNSAHLSVAYSQALIISLVNEFTLGILIAAGIFSHRQYLSRIVCYVIIPLVCFAQLACFHYEAVFGRLPDVDVLFYLTQLSHLSSSLDKGFPLFWVTFEFFLLTGVLYLCIFKLKSEKKSESLPKVYQFIAFVAVGLSVLLQAVPTIIPDKYFWGTREPLVWLMQSRFIKDTYEIADLHLSEQDFSDFLYFHGKTSLLPNTNPDYPLCRQDISGIEMEGKPKRNIILLVLEGIGKAEMAGNYNQVALMPNLQKISEENLSFKKIFAPGTKSIQTLPAIFSGLPANPHNNYLWRDLLLNFNGFPNRLREEGYHTAYLHGGDLSFEFQRSYLERVGFGEIIEFDPNKEHEVNGWGYSDDVMFQELRDWIYEYKEEYGNRPYLASLFTLSTHHPYILPDDWKPVFSDVQIVKKDKLSWYHYQRITEMELPLAEAIRFLDYHLGKFYQWYRANEEDSILIITGDHAFNLFNQNEVLDERFDVPLIIAGLTDEERRQYGAYQDRIGSSNDLPATIMGLLGLSPHQCDLGINLLSSEKKFEHERYVYSVSGGSSERMRIWTKESEVLYDRMRNNIQQREYASAGKFEEIEKGSKRDRLVSFINNILPAHYYLLYNNAYYPPPEKIADKTSLQQVEEPIYVSHRGNLSVKESSINENSREALDAVIESEFEWVEVDVQMTKDGEFILMHDSHIDVNGESLSIYDMTLSELHALDGYANILTLEELIANYSPYINLLIEIKSRQYVRAFEFLHMSREVARIVKNRKSKNEVIVDSFDQEVVISVKKQCDCEVGFDTPYKKVLSENELRDIKSLGIDWIYVEYSVIDSELISMAHRLGLKVMAYTVNSSDVINRWKQNGMLPDGVITDDIKVIH